MSSNSESAPVEGPRPFTITPDDHRGVVMSLAVLFIIYAFMIIGLRLAARMRTMGVDDWLAILATVSSLPDNKAIVADSSRCFLLYNSHSLLVQCTISLESPSISIAVTMLWRLPRQASPFEHLPSN